MRISTTSKLTTLVLAILVALTTKQLCLDEREINDSNQNHICCPGGIILSSWALSHYKDVRILANAMRKYYHSLSQGDHRPNLNYAFPPMMGKSDLEIKNLVQHNIENIINSINSGRLSRTNINQTNFFEQEASNLLESLERENKVSQIALDLKSSTTREFSNKEYERHKSFGEGKRFPVLSDVRILSDQFSKQKQNCTPSLFQTNLISNDKTILNHSYKTSNFQPKYLKQTSTHSIYSYQNKEDSQIPLWTAQVILDENSKDKYLNIDKPAVLIPVSPSMNHLKKFDVPNFYFSNKLINNNPDKNFEINGLENHSAVKSVYNGDHSEITINNYNRSTVTSSGKNPMPAGKTEQTLIKNGNFILSNSNSAYINNQENWMVSEREILLWLFVRNITIEELRIWQSQQEERLHNIAHNFNISIENIEQFHIKELNEFKYFCNEQSSSFKNMKEWQIREKIRIQWLFERNFLSKKDFKEWQIKNNSLLDSLAHFYGIPLSDLSEFQEQQFFLLHDISNFQSNALNEFHKWQEQERDRLHTIIKNHNITVEELQNQIRKDQEHVINISEDFHVNVTEIKNWFIAELNRLTELINEQKSEIKRLTEWQQQERYRLENIILKTNVTVEELKRELNYDKNYLSYLAQKYQITDEELKKWHIHEIGRLQNIGTVTTKNRVHKWQEHERKRLISILQENNYTIKEFQNKIAKDRINLKNLAEQYQVKVEEIEDWIKNEIVRLESEGFLRNAEENLMEWKNIERNNLIMFIKQHNLDFKEFEQKIKQDYSYFINLVLRYNVQIKDIEDWIEREIEILKSEGISHLNIEEWKKIVREQLNRLFLDKDLTIDEIEYTILKERQQLLQLTNLYNISIEELENFIDQEIARLKTLNSSNVFQNGTWEDYERKRLEDFVFNNSITKSQLEYRTLENKDYLDILARIHKTTLSDIKSFYYNEINRLERIGLLMPIEANTEQNYIDWKKREKNYLLLLIKNNSFSAEKLREHIKEDRYRLEKMAFLYKIKIEEIEEFLQSQIQVLLNENVLHESENLLEWHRKEREFIQKILVQHHMTYDELENRLKNDYERLQSLGFQYHIEISQLLEWYNKELNRLLINGEISIELNYNWKKIEEERLLKIVSQNFYTLEEFRLLLWDNQISIKVLAETYRITVDELQKFQESVIATFNELGYFNRPVTSEMFTWQKAEKNRIYFIIKELKITIIELSEFLENDVEFNAFLSKKYGVSDEFLKKWQEKVLQELSYENKFDNTVIIVLQYWQKRERDRLYMLIGNHHIQSMTDLIKWQENLQNIENISAQYKIRRETLIKWQQNELNRIINVGKIYKMSITELAKFRQNELDRLRTLAHRVSITNNEYSEWFYNEMLRFENLINKFSLSINTLDHWRRVLLLHCQGLIAQDNENNVTDSVFDVTAQQNVSISLDRGDQPPHTYQEDYDDQEPNIYGQKPTIGPIQEREPTSHTKIDSIKPTASLRGPINNRNMDTYQRLHQKQVTTLTVPTLLQETKKIVSSEYNRFYRSTSFENFNNGE